MNTRVVPCLHFLASLSRLSAWRLHCSPRDSRRGVWWPVHFCCCYPEAQREVRTQMDQTFGNTGQSRVAKKQRTHIRPQLICKGTAFIQYRRIFGSSYRSLPFIPFWGSEFSTLCAHSKQRSSTKPPEWQLSLLAIQ